MFKYNSRYYSVADAIYVTPDGKQLTYKQRRFLPSVEESSTGRNHTIQPGERLDTVSKQTLGNPLLFWQIADANAAMNPFDLTEVPGTILRIPNPTKQP